jgi:hypothetical protein
MNFFFDALAFIRSNLNYKYILDSLKNIRLNCLQNSQMIDLDHEYTIKVGSIKIKYLVSELRSKYKNPAL